MSRGNRKNAITNQGKSVNKTLDGCKRVNDCSYLIESKRIMENSRTIRLGIISASIVFITGFICLTICLTHKNGIYALVGSAIAPGGIISVLVYNYSRGINRKLISSTGEKPVIPNLPEKENNPC